MIYTLIFTACVFGYSHTACVHEEHYYSTSKACQTAGELSTKQWSRFEKWSDDNSSFTCMEHPH
jgi:hypothetical protein